MKPLTPDEIKLETAQKILRRLILIRQEPEDMIKELARMIEDLKARMAK